MLRNPTTSPADRFLAPNGRETVLTVALVLGIAFGGVVLRLAFEPVLGERGLYLLSLIHI